MARMPLFSGCVGVGGGGGGGGGGGLHAWKDKPGNEATALPSGCCRMYGFLHS